MSHDVLADRPSVATASAQERGFLLLVVVGLLAVLLVVCIGFLSFTRGEVMAVNTQRNKGDTQDIMHSAMDYTIANICHDLMDGAGNMDQTQPCAYTINPGSTKGAPWWLRTMQLGSCKFLSSVTKSPTTGGWNFPLQPATQPGAETQWIYFPADFFPGGAIRGRAQVLVFDTNAVINVNDWNEDCNPSQAQMAHMVADAYGYFNLENMRWCRDVGPPGKNGPLPTAPLRYQEGWRVGSHSARYLAWPDWDTSGGGPPIWNTASYTWVTGNTSWLSMYGPQYSCISATLPSDGLWLAQGSPALPYQGSQNYATINPNPPPNFGDRTTPGVDPENGKSHIFTSRNPQSAGHLDWSMPGFYTTAYTDPDTGRSPINVNTCYNSGEILPYNYWSGPIAGDPPVRTYTMEGVWNVESLRRIIKVGYFYDPWPSTNHFNAATQQFEKRPAGNNWSNAQYDWIFLDPRSKMLVETLKLQLAYQYQETLCRYFTGSYVSKSTKFVPGISAPLPPAAPKTNVTIGTYAATYKAPKTPAPYPAHSCSVTDYTMPRFPVSLVQFRKNVHDDFSQCLASTTAANYTNPDYTASANTALIPARLANDDAAHTDGSVNFTYEISPLSFKNQIVYIPEIALGKLDMRTACACYDNMVPGKPADITDFQGCNPYDAGDPIYEMYMLQAGRQEDYDDPYQIDPAAIHNNGWGVGDNRNLRGRLGAWPYPAQSWPMPWPLPASTPITNIYSRWVDNPRLNATSRYSSNLYPDPNWEMQMYDHNPIPGKTPQPMTILPKGNDICSYNSIVGSVAQTGPFTFNASCGFGSPTAVPTGPWLDDLPLVPLVTAPVSASYTIMRPLPPTAGWTYSTNGFNQQDRQAYPLGGYPIGEQQKNHDVPWRQMCFTPDSFSTELTTTSTTFILIINAQLVDQASVAANPANPALHQDQSWNQWGVVVEVAPDAYAEVQAKAEPASDFVFPMAGWAAPDPNMNTVSATAPAPPKGTFFNWYLNEMPRRTKTYQGTLPMFDPSWAVDGWLDDTCPSLMPRNIGNTAAYTTPFGRTSGQPRMYGGRQVPWLSPGNVFVPALVGGAAESENSTATHIRDWKKSNNPLTEATTGCDIKQVPPAGVPSGRGADVIYTPANKIKKRVIIRSIWCLNEGIEQ